ncbi:MAG: hypothetical protein JW797_00645 [Bradymonadales bacterium]|nr:hypothetical protein [Bradymonadales bacterium]
MGRSATDNAEPDREHLLAGWPLHPAIAAISCICAVLSAGCSDSEGLATCRTEGDCAQGEVCQVGVCIPLCQSHDDCVFPRVCKGGFCAMSTRCGSQDDCEYGEACISGRCIPQVPECSTAAECPPGHTCDRGACVLRPDPDDAGEGEQDQGTDPIQLDESETGPDQQDTGTDMESDPTADLPVDPDLQNDHSDAATDPTNDCEGRRDGRLGDSCEGASDCCNGLCLGDPGTGQGVCTQPCTTWTDCNPSGLAVSMYCYELTDNSRYCALSDFAEPCDSPDTCTGEVCLHGYGTSGCSWFCELTAQCPPGTACGLVSFWDEENQVIVEINTCAPVGNLCTLYSGEGLNDCLSGICLTEESASTGFCSTFCNSYDDPQPCPSGYRCEIVEEGYPPLCIP